MERLLVTTLVGLENYATRELASLGYRAEPVRKGRLLVRWGRVPTLNYISRTLERVIELIDIERGVQTLEDIRSVAASIDWDEYIPLERSFAVRTERVGQHDFRSVDVEREAGGAIVEWFLERYGRRPPVNLEDPWITVRVDVDGDVLFIGLDTTGAKALHKRGWRVYDHPASLNATLASAILMGSTWKDLLLDPMAGGGTIPIEAELGRRRVPHFFFRGFAFERWGRWNVWRVRERFRRKIRWIADDIYGGEKFRKHVEGCKQNVKSAGVVRVKCFQWDATELERLPFTPRYIITNPPYGLRIANPGVTRKLYWDFAHSAHRAGTEEIVTVTTKWKTMRECLEGAGFQVEVGEEVLYGKLPVRILVARR